MRISTSLLYQAGTDAIGRTESDLLRTQQQIATGRRMQSPGDDPVASAQALLTRAARAETGRFQDNVARAKDALGFDDSILGQITDVLQNVRTGAINANNPALSDADRRSLAADMASQLEQLVGLANTRDANGNYLYAGYQSGLQPFADHGSGYAYSGDQGRRTIEVSPDRVMEISESGSSLFEQVRSGNGTFAVAAAAGNTGTAVIAGGSVANPSALTGHAYALQFSVTGGVTTYDVLDTTAGTTVSTGNAYTSGTAVTVAGMQVTISGAPASGDALTIAPSAPQSIFTTLKQLIATLQAPGGSGAASARLGNGINAGLQNIDQALEHVLLARSDVGAKLRELDVLADKNDATGLQQDQTVSRLEDVDYNAALSHFAQQQTALTAAQKSFLQVTGLSLFQYL